MLKLVPLQQLSLNGRGFHENPGGRFTSSDKRLWTPLMLYIGAANALWRVPNTEKNISISFSIAWPCRQKNYLQGSISLVKVRLCWTYLNGWRVWQCWTLFQPPTLQHCQTPALTDLPAIWMCAALKWKSNISWPSLNCLTLVSRLSWWHGQWSHWRSYFPQWIN